MEDKPAVYLVTGPMAAGKSTVARLLAARFGRGVHLEGDVFRRSIVSGRVDMTPDPSPEALRQLRLRYRLAAAPADGYVEAGFTVARSRMSPPGRCSPSTAKRSTPSSGGQAHSLAAAGVYPDESRSVSSSMRFPNGSRV